MSFWSDLSAELSAGIKALTNEFSTLAPYFKPMLVASAQELGQAALSAVLAEAPKLISGSEKLSAATSNVITTLGVAGKTIAAADAQAAVQAAYNALAAAVHPSAK